MSYRKALKQGLALFFICFLGGCGDSPLLNHKDKNQISSESVSPRASVQKSCDLKFEPSQICASLTWIAGPTKSATQNGDILQIDFWSGTTQEKIQIPKEQLLIKLWMPSMGHGSSRVTIEKSDDSFLVKEIFFIMPGKWEIWFTLHPSSGDEEKQKIEVSI